MRFILFVERAGLVLITLATIVAIGQELHVIYQQGRVELHDILLLFIYLEILTMVALYFTSGKLPVRYPIYISIVAITRFIILGMKEMNAQDIILLAGAILLLTLASVVLRYGSFKLPYKQDNID
ncbi:MAG: phosphate starvation-inducible protein PhoH [Gammaproteobacteria bacterium]|nr:MAG: phosphate starvation-inducible protein PhoH [Gammaproteobacteria bacterium]